MLCSRSRKYSEPRDSTRKAPIRSLPHRCSNERRIVAVNSWYEAELSTSDTRTSSRPLLDRHRLDDQLVPRLGIERYLCSLESRRHQLLHVRSVECGRTVEAKTTDDSAAAL